MKMKIIVLLAFVNVIQGQYSSFSFLFDKKSNNQRGSWRPFWTWNWDWNPLQSRENYSPPPSPSPPSDDTCVDMPRSSRPPFFCNMVDCNTDEGLFECKKTCKLCDIRCTDLDSVAVCSMNLALGRCSSRDFSTRCENTCGLCQVSDKCIDTPRPTRSNTYCTTNINNCHTQSMRQECAKTCQLCATSIATPQSNSQLPIPTIGENSGP